MGNFLLPTSIPKDVKSIASEYREVICTINLLVTINYPIINR